jgi:hypothetical protein
LSFKKQIAAVGGKKGGRGFCGFAAKQKKGFILFRRAEIQENFIK